MYYDSGNDAPFMTCTGFEILCTFSWNKERRRESEFVRRIMNLNMVNTTNHRRSIKNCVASHTANLSVYFLLAIIVCTISLKAFGDEAIVVTKIAGNEYHIPAKYLGYPAQTNENDILLDAILPHMEAVDKSSKLLPESEKGNQVIILVHAASSTTSLEYRLSVAQKNYGPLHGNGNKFGLNAYVGSTEGIAPRQHDPSVPETKIVEELYTDAAQTSPPSLFIHCAGDLAVPSPGCDMVFISQDLLYEIHFQKHHVGEWQSIEQSAEKLVDSFRSRTIFSHPTVNP